jgi:hypothetical protein
VKRVLAGRRASAKRLAVTLDPQASIVETLAAVEEGGFDIESVEVAEEDEARRLDVIVRAPADTRFGPLLDRVANLQGVRSVVAAE